MKINQKNKNHLNGTTTGSYLFGMPVNNFGAAMVFVAVWHLVQWRLRKISGCSVHFPLHSCYVLHYRRTLLLFALQSRLTGRRPRNRTYLKSTTLPLPCLKCEIQSRGRLSRIDWKNTLKDNEYVLASSRRWGGDEGRCCGGCCFFCSIGIIVSAVEHASAIDALLYNVLSQ